MAQMTFWKEKQVERVLLEGTVRSGNEYLRSEEAFSCLLKREEAPGPGSEQIDSCCISKLLTVCFGTSRSAIAFMHSKL